MQPLFTCLYGSHLYGTSTPESDHDYKTVVLWDFDKLLLGKAPKISTNKTNTEFCRKNSAEDVDDEYIPVQIFAQHFMEGQSYALELAHNVEGTEAGQVVYDPRFVTFCRELRENFLTNETHAIARFATDQAELYTVKGERLNTALATRELYASFPQFARVEDHLEAFTEAARKLEEQFPETFKLTEYDSNGRGLMAPCTMMLQRTLPHSGSFSNNLRTIDATIKKYGDRSKQAAGSEADWKATMHAVRIVSQGIRLLEGEGLRLPHRAEFVGYLLSIRRGEHPYGVVMGTLQFGLAELERLAEVSTLPRNTPETRAKLEAWLVGWMKRFYFETGVTYGH
jgi:hypothetical protein